MFNVHIASSDPSEYAENKRFDLETLINDRKLNYADEFFNKSVIQDFDEAKVLKLIDFLNNILNKDF